MKRDVFTCVISLLAIVVILLPGCGPPKTKTVKVTGKITVDGNPIEMGTISFHAVDGEVVSGGGVIANGIYEAEVPPGKKKVLVVGQKVSGTEPLYKDMPDSPTRDTYQLLTPFEYNHKETTPLEAEITGATKDLNFDVDSKFKSR